MSMVYRFAADSMLSFRALDTELQETVLDVLEDLSENPWRLRPDVAREAIHESEILLRDVRYVIFLNLLIDLEAGHLTVLGVGAGRAPI